MNTKAFHQRASCALGLILVVLSGLRAKAQIVVWTNQASGRWDNALDWDPNGLVGGPQSIYITNAGADISITNGVVAKQVIIDNQTTSFFPGTLAETDLTLSGAGTNVVNWLALTNAGTNVSLHISNAVTLAPGSLLSVTNSSLQVDGFARVGAPPPTGFIANYGAFLTENSGRLSVTNVSHTAALGITTNGTITLAGGLMQVDNLILTNGGLFEDTGGTLAFTNAFQLEEGTTVDVNGGSITAATNFTLGSVLGGTNSLMVRNGGVLTVTNGSLGLGNKGNISIGLGLGSASIDTGGRLDVATLNLGSISGGRGNLALGNGTVNVRSSVTVVGGSLPSSLNINGGSFFATNGLIQVGQFGNGLFTISAGTHIIRQLLLGGSGPTSSGSFLMSGGFLQILGNGSGPGAGVVANSFEIDGGDIDGTGTTITIGDNGHSASALMKGGFARFASMYDGYQPGYSGTYTQLAGSMVVSSNLIVGDDCPAGTNGAIGTVTLSGGALYVTNATHTSVLDVRNGTFTLGSGATLVVDNLVLTNACGYFTNNGGVLLSGTGFHTGNLLLNPGADLGTTDNWMATGANPPGVDDGTAYPVLPHTGGYDFIGGGGFGSLSQVVSLIGNQGITAAQLDSGQLTVYASFWEQTLTNHFGVGPPYDDALVILSFLDAASNTISLMSTPELESHNGYWSNYTAHYLVPPGTRSINYTVNFIPHGDIDEVFVDDNLLLASLAQGTQLPSLSIFRAGSNVVISWPASATNFTLQSTTNLSATNSWQPITNIPEPSPTGLAVTNATSGQNLFYRLLGH
jgi:hypothetical protein